MKLLGVYLHLDIASLNGQISSHHPDVTVLGFREVNATQVSRLFGPRNKMRSTGIVLLASSFSGASTTALRQMAAGWSAGMAVFLRQSLSRVDQVATVIKAVSRRNTVIDPALNECSLAMKPSGGFLQQLTGKELEVLNLLASGYTNSKIAVAQYIDVKTVEHHINSVYSKLKTDADVSGKHLRVEASRIYWREVMDM